MLHLGWLLPIKNTEDVKSVRTFFLSNKTCVATWTKAMSLLRRLRALGLCQCFPVKSGDWGSFPGKSREAFLSQALSLTHPCGSQSLWSQRLSLPSSLLGLFLEHLPLSPSPVLRVRVWLVFLGSRPSELQLCLLFVLTEISLWYSVVRVPCEGTPTAFFPAWVEDSKCTNTRAFQPLVHREESCRIILCRISNTQICRFVFLIFLIEV